MRVVIAIPTTNRPDVVAPTIRDITRQSRLPDAVVVVIASPDDIDLSQQEGLPFQLEVMQSPRGLTIQRNAALSMLKPEDILLFLDDDFVMSPDYLENLERLFAEDRSIAMTTGKVLADGIHGPGIDHDEGAARAFDPAGRPSKEPKDIYNCYGCNMALRGSIVVSTGIRFDEQLKLYGWLEDVDFSRQMAAHGRIVQADQLQGVHLGTKTGRSKGLFLGYSQIANPYYLYRKGTMVLHRALNIVLRNIFKNLIGSLRPEPEIDRWGRLKGNFAALYDLCHGRLRPENVLTLK